MVDLTQLGSTALASGLSQLGAGAPTQDMRVRLGALDPSLYTLNSSSTSSLGGPLGNAISSAISGTLGGTNSIMSILADTNGMLFPYSPSITLSQTVDYMDIALVHSNTNYQAYTRTPSVKISVNGKFTVQNQREGQYALAAIHFLRTASKSHFGENDPQAGLPPPVLLFSGYGNYMFGNAAGQLGPGGLRVILTSHSWSYDENVDTVPIVVGNTGGAAQSVIQALSQAAAISGSPLSSFNSNFMGGGVVRLPSMFTITCELTVIQTPTRMRQQFSFQSFASGELMQNSNGWI